MTQNKDRKVRVALTLPPDIDSVLSKFAELTKQPKTKVITGLLEDMLPTLNQALDALIAARDGKKELIIDVMNNFIERATSTRDQAEIDFGLSKGAGHGR